MLRSLRILTATAGLAVLAPLAGAQRTLAMADHAPTTGVAFVQDTTHKPVTPKQVGKNVRSETHRAGARTRDEAHKVGTQTNKQAKRTGKSVEKLVSRKARHDTTE